jgi:lipopolysaccharide biosynthesis glycosyltransferase
MDYRLNGTNRYMDQDAFNGAMYDEIKLIPSRYNFLMQITDFKDIEEINEQLGCNWNSIEACIDDVLILHFAGPIKPWKYNRPWFTDIFMDYYEKAGYSAKELKLLSPLRRLNGDKDWLKAQIKAECGKDYIFPYEKVPAGSRIVIWGAGNVGKSYKKQVDYTSYCQLIKWVDEKNTVVDNPEEIKSLEYDYVIVATVNPVFANQIKKRLEEEMHCLSEKVISPID